MNPRSPDGPLAGPAVTPEEPAPRVLELPADSRSPWLETQSNDTQPAPQFAPLEGEISVDVAIVGGGITGLSAAYFLSGAGLKVAVLEAHRIAEGETGHTTAHLTAFPDQRLSGIVSRFDDDHARSVWAAGMRAIELIEENVRSAELDCGFKRVPGFLYTETDAGTAELEREHAACRSLAIPSTLARDGLPTGLPMKAALRFDDQAQIHPLRYLAPLAQAIVRRGGRIFEGTRVVQVHEENQPTVVSERGVVRARDVIVAANVPVDTRVALQTKIAHYRSYALGIRTPQPMPDGLFWDDQDPYHYVRKHRIGDADLLIVGGEDHRTGQEVNTNERFEKLLEWTRERLPVRSVEFRWSGQIVVPVDALPYVGARSDHIWEATGYAGNGMTFGTIAASILADRIQGKENAWSALFEPKRVTPLASAVDFVKENASTAYHYVMDRLAIDPTRVAELPRGEGTIYNLRMRRVAIYRDEHGELHTLSPSCTHLHCIVAFNRAEKTWDCPCHGSRFSVDGEVLNGPATRPLEKIEVELPIDHRPQPVDELRGNDARA